MLNLTIRLFGVDVLSIAVGADDEPDGAPDFTSQPIGFVPPRRPAALGAKPDPGTGGMVMATAYTADYQRPTPRQVLGVRRALDRRHATYVSASGALYVPILLLSEVVRWADAKITRRFKEPRCR